MAHSEQLDLTDSLVNRILEPGYLPDVTALQATMSGVYTGPALEILEEPKQRGFRFRYPCEGPSHGGLPGELTEKGKKTYPSVQLRNYKGSARIVVSLVTVEEPARPHAHSLVGKNAQNGTVTVQISQEQGMTASFPNLGIQHVTKKNVSKVLMERYVQMQALHTATLNAMADNSTADGYNISMYSDEAIGDGNRAEFDRNIAEVVAEEEAAKVRREVDEQTKTMNLSAVRLCFQALLPDDRGCFTKALPPCISQAVYDSKAPSASALKICKMDRTSGCVTGADEVYLLCDRVQKDDIEVHFYEDDTNGSRFWEAQGLFAPSDVHRQFAIVFKTPPYWNLAIERASNVFIQLRRKSDKETSEPVVFTYQPQEFDKEQIGAKRRKKIPHFQDYFSGGGGAPGGGGGPGAAGGGGGGSGMGLGSGLPFGSFLNFNLGFGTGVFSGSQGGGAQEGTVQPPTDDDKPVPNAALGQMALALAERSTSAMRDYASTGDVRYILAVQRHLTAVQDDNGDSALHLAVINSQLDVVRSLLDVMAGLSESYVNEYNYLRQTPLHLAVITKQPRVIECLLQAKADVTLRDRHGNTPAHIACAQADVASMKMLVNRALRLPVGFSDLDMHNYEGLTPVHLAVLVGNKEILKQLTSSGADMNAQDGSSGRSPLHHAVETDNLALAGYLILEAGCDVDSVTYDGNTPLHVAAGRGLKGQTALLVAAGANTCAENSEEETAYDLANVAEVQEILSEDDILSKVPTDQSDPSGISGFSLDEGDMDQVDHYLRRQMAHLLDPTDESGRDWKLLAKKVGLGSLVAAIGLNSSPTVQLLAQYEAAEGSIQNLRQALLDMGREDVVEILNRVPGCGLKTRQVGQREDSGLGLDSGLGSQSLSSERLQDGPFNGVTTLSGVTHSSSRSVSGITRLESKPKEKHAHQFRQLEA